MIWKYIIRDLNGAIQYLPYGVMAGAVMGLILNAMNARRERKGKEAFPMAGLMVFSLYLMIILVITFFSREDGSRNRAMDLELFSTWGINTRNNAFVVENVSLPEELQKAIDTRISMGMMGDLGKYTQYQMANAIPLAAQNEGGLAGLGAGLAAGVGMGQMMTQAMGNAFNPAAVAQAAIGGQATPAATTPATAADDPAARLEKLKGLLDKGLISQADYDTAKAEVLKKLMG